MHYEVIIIGAGQAGLSMGYYLKQSGTAFVILDRASEIGEVWRNRYDSLTLFTPDVYSSLPGLKLTGCQNTYPAKNDIADYLKAYAAEFSLPVQLDTTVVQLAKTQNGFEVSTNRGEYTTKSVIIATGPFQKPFVPEFSRDLTGDIYQVHSAHYKNPEQLKKGSVLIAGGGNYGAQIAVEVSKQRETYLSAGHRLIFFPQDIGGKSIFWYFNKTGLYRASEDSVIGRFLKKQPDPIFGLDLKYLLNNGNITLKPRTKSVKEDYIEFEDSSTLKISNIIWATGYKADYSWVDLPGLFNKKGEPIHRRGISVIDDLYFLGLAWQSNRSSALLQGVGADAKYLHEFIVNKK